MVSNLFDLIIFIVAIFVLGDGWEQWCNYLDRKNAREHGLDLDANLPQRED